MKLRHLPRGKRVIALASGLTIVAATTAAADVSAIEPTPSAGSAVTGSDAAGSDAAGSVARASLAAADPALPDGITERIGGANRYETAALIAAEYGTDVDVVYVASGEVFPDALTARAAGGPADGQEKRDASAEGESAQDVPRPDVDGSGVAAPVLLTEAATLPDATIEALTDLAPQEIRIVGGEKRITPAVQTQLEAFAPVERYAGDDRYETSAKVAGLFPSGLPVVYVATGETFPDALVGGAVAGREGAPILLTQGSELSGPTAEALAGLAPQAVVVFGGPNTVDEDTLAAITDIVPATTRVFGEDRYDTAAVISSAYEKDLDKAYLATGKNYPDALTGSALAAYQGAPLLLTKTSLPATTAKALDRLSPQGATLLGGPLSVSDDNAMLLDAALPEWIDQIHLQLLSFNDYHGHLEVDSDGVLTEAQDPDQNSVGGATYLSSTLTALRTASLPDQSMTVAAGDLIGGSPFLSGIFHDEPSVESLNLMGLDVSSVGNHEFDEGTTELLRMQEGGCHPVDGCYFPDQPYSGADFPWLSANVVKDDGKTLLPGTYTQDIAGVEVGFIGMTLEATPTLVSPGGVSSVEFLDEVDTANAAATELQDAGVKSIVVLLHEGGYQDGGYSQCDGISGPIVDIAEGLDPAIDMVITGHTHQPYVCDIPDPDGNPRLVTSANQYGRVVTESDVVLSQSSTDVVRDDTTSQNTLVLQNVADPAMDAVIAKWKDKSNVVGAEVVGTLAEDITGSAGGDRGIETPLADLIADSILFGTEGADQGNAEISFTNVGGVRADLLVDQITNGEQPGEVTYAEAFTVLPFGNILVSIDMTGADIKAVLEQQYDPARGRQNLALGVSEGFTYTWDDTQDQGSRVSGMELDGVPLQDGMTYRVSTLNFLAEGGDDFTAFTNGTDLLGGPGDFQNLVDFMGEKSPLEAPKDRVEGL